MNSLSNLKRAIRECDVESAGWLAQQCIDEGEDPLAAMGGVTEAIREVGMRFEREEIWLPELVGAAAALQKATPILEAAIRGAGREKRSVGSVAIGTVKGDIHSIGKSMVATLLVAEGFDVHDLGVDVPADAFIKALREHHPDVLAMSALMTTTSNEMKKVVESIDTQKLRDKTKVIVGGPINSEFAKRIGADGYSATAPGGAKLARALLVGAE